VPSLLFCWSLTRGTFGTWSQPDSWFLLSDLLLAVGLLICVLLYFAILVNLPLLGFVAVAELVVMAEYRSMKRSCSVTVAEKYVYA
jgi:hypothetical protein